MEKRHHVTVARMLYWKDCVVVPPGNEELLTKLLVEFHSSTTAEFLRAYARIATYFYRPRMRRTILELVHSCQICQRAKSSQLHPRWQKSLPIPIPNQVWEDVEWILSQVFLIQKVIHLLWWVRPQNDGRYEALNKCLELYLRCFVFDNPRACRGKNPYIHWNDDFEGVRWARPMMFCCLKDHAL
ncbi:ty3-gypsy retrotransposon protein [Tanacetum coccineum]